MTGRVLADLACAIADGAEVISDFRVMADQQELFGLVASVPTCWRALSEIAGGGSRPLARITVAVNAARRRGWGQIVARHGGLPGVVLGGSLVFVDEAAEDGPALDPPMGEGQRWGGRAGVGVVGGCGGVVVRCGAGHTRRGPTAGVVHRR
jgi:hypothetical protein